MTSTPNYKLSISDKTSRIGLSLVLIFLLLNSCQPATQATTEPLPSQTPSHTPSLTAIPPSITPSNSALPVENTPSPSPSQMAETTALSCISEPGQVLGISLEDEDQMQILTVQIYLPPCYPSQNETLYPLLVLLHGQGYDQNQWFSMGLAATADEMIASDLIPPVIVLMPLEEFVYQDPAQSTFDEMIIDVLLPWVGENFSACKQVDCRAVGGISRGGAWALHIGSDHPELFTGIGMHSAPPFPADQYRLVRVLRDLPESQRPSLFIDVGDFDTYRSYILEFHEDLLDQGVAHTWNTAEGGHEDEYWQSHLEEYLRWYGSILE